MKLTLFRAGDKLTDKAGRSFTLYSSPLGEASPTTECELCCEQKLIGYRTTTAYGTQEFVCTGCLRILVGAYAPSVLLQQLKRLVWTGSNWSDDISAARVFDTVGVAEQEHARFGYGPHIIVAARDKAADVLKKNQANRK